MPESAPRLYQSPHAHRTAERLIEAATPLFAADGLRRVRIERIAAEADVAIGSIHVHYGSKERLFLAVVERSLELCLSYTGRRAWSPSPVARLRSMGEAFADFALAHPAEFRIVGERATERTGIAEHAAIERRIDGLMQHDIFQLVTDAHAAIEAGEIRALPVQQVVAYFWALWSGLIAMTNRTDGFGLRPEQLRSMLADAADILERGLAPSGEPSRAAGGGLHAA